MKTSILQYLILLFIISSCNSDDDIIAPHPNLGEYRLISLSSDIALDLNYDGTQSSDFKKELEFYWDYPTNPQYGLELLTSSGGLDKWIVRMNLPADYHNPDFPLSNKRFGYSDYSKTATIKNDTVYFIKHTLSNESYQDSIWFVDTEKYPYPYKIDFINSSTTKIKVVQKFYDLEANEWITAYLDAFYQKE